MNRKTEYLHEPSGEHLCIPEEWTALDLELHFIQNGGTVTVDGKDYGNGLYFHYHRAIELAWPDEDNHRWSDLILKSIVENRNVVLVGARDSGKTRGVSKFALIDYWANPQTTLILMTSTTITGLEMRVWGDIKNLFRSARERFPNLAGNVVDAKHGLFTDNISEDSELRVMTKGIIGIPLLSSQNEYQGMTLKNFAGIKQKRRRLVGDECFPAGTLVDTPLGPKPIETILPGDKVLNAIGHDTVIGVRRSFSASLCRVTTRDGRSFVCTKNHKLFTQKGWIKSADINREHYILSGYEAMCVMRSGVFSTGKNVSLSGVLGEAETVRVLRKNIGDGEKKLCAAFLQSELRRQMENATAGISRQDIYRGKVSKDVQGETQVASGSPGICGLTVVENESEESDAWKEDKRNNECRPIFKRGAGRQWSRGYQGRENLGWTFERRISDKQFCDPNWTWKLWLSDALQSGFGNSQIAFDSRSRREQPLQPKGPRARLQEEQHAYGSWVESCEVLQPSDFEADNAGGNGVEVFNLHVKNHHTYSVEGFCVSNCQFVPAEYLKTLDAMDKGEFKSVLLGNPIANNGKALDKVSEPKDGWGSEGEIVKTTCWKNKYGGITVNLVGIDSPNFDPETRNKFPYLTDQKDVETVSARPGGRDSVEWWSLIMGVRKAGVIMNRVLTVDMVRQHRGFEKAHWVGLPEMRVLGIDAGFGGDACMFTDVTCGMDVSGLPTMQFGEQVEAPIRVGGIKTAEEQIAEFTRDYCFQKEIPYSHVFVECGMRATLAVTMTRMMSAEINAINFGGAATDEPVSDHLYVEDKETGYRRLKTCYEHYSKYVTQLAYRVRQYVETGQCRAFPLAAAEEFERRETRFVYNDRHELETKAEYKERNSGESPNRSDSIFVCVEGARRLGFRLVEQKPEESPDPEPSALADMQRQHHERLRKRLLPLTR